MPTRDLIGALEAIEPPARNVEVLRQPKTFGRATSATSDCLKTSDCSEASA